MWKGKCEWVDEQKLEADDAIANSGESAVATKPKRAFNVEKLVVGWGDTAWLLHVHSSNSTTASGKRQVGSADIIHKLHFSPQVLGRYGMTLLVAVVSDLCRPWSRLRSVLLRWRWPGPFPLMTMSGCCSSEGILPSEKSMLDRRLALLKGIESSCLGGRGAVVVGRVGTRAKSTSCAE